MTARGTGHREVLVLSSLQEIAHEGARIFARTARERAAAGELFRVALSGGSTPRALYGILTSGEYRTGIEWDKVRFFFGDERWVPHDHPDSNYKLAKDHLFDKLGIGEKQVFPMPAEGLSPEEAASQYEETLRREFGIPRGKVPRFDLLLQGMGDDGHTASLFPHTDVLRERRRLVAAPFVEKLESYRITLTPPVLQAGVQVVFMAAGESKNRALKEVLEGEENIDEYPSQLLRRARGKITWLVDDAAASLLSRPNP